MASSHRPLATFGRGGITVTAHDSFIPVGPAILPVPGATGFSLNVRVNGDPAHHVGNVFELHYSSVPVLCPIGDLHRDRISSGCINVFINGRPAVRPGDSISWIPCDVKGLTPVTVCGKISGPGSYNVYVNSATIVA